MGGDYLALKEELAGFLNRGGNIREFPKITPVAKLDDISPGDAVVCVDPEKDTFKLVIIESLQNGAKLCNTESYVYRGNVFVPRYSMSQQGIILVKPDADINLLSNHGNTYKLSR
jgi:hypothetical protein